MYNLYRITVPLLLISALLPTIAFGQSNLPPCLVAQPITTWDDCYGKAKYTGSRYIGEFRNGERDGIGNVKYASSNKYIGGFKNGERNGHGTYTFSNGNQYIGAFRDGEFNGKGTYTYVNGDKYVGEFKDNKHHGQGTHTKANGDKYIGGFKNGERNGHGTGNTYVGEFTNNKFNGQLTYSDGTKYAGETEDGVPVGRGTSTKPNDDTYVGEFNHGQPNGQGTRTFSNGNKYVGGFKEGYYDGQGTYFAADGSVKSSGFWADGNFLGMRSDRETVSMVKSGGVFVVPVRFNDTITLNAVVDSGASDVSIPADVVLTLMRTETITREDFLGEQTYVLADGSKVPSQQFRIRAMKVGNRTAENVVGSIASVNGTILLGQSFLSKFKSWSVDNEQHALILR